jgi:5-carboxymethyl-2-hydroxymuconate isomerase
MNEIDEFYSYVEMPQVAENLKAWNGSFPGGKCRYLRHRLKQANSRDAEWIQSDFQKRKAHVEVLLESLEHRDAEVRFTNARRLFYILQGILYLQSAMCLLTLPFVQERSQRRRLQNTNYIGSLKTAKSSEQQMA